MKKPNPMVEIPPLPNFDAVRDMDDTEMQMMFIGFARAAQATGKYAQTQGATQTAFNDGNAFDAAQAAARVVDWGLVKVLLDCMEMQKNRLVSLFDAAVSMLSDGDDCDTHLKVLLQLGYELAGDHKNWHDLRDQLGLEAAND